MTIMQGISLGVVILGWIVTATVLWTKMGTRVLVIQEAITRIQSATEDTSKAFRSFERSFNANNLDIQVRLAKLEKTNE